MTLLVSQLLDHQGSTGGAVQHAGSTIGSVQHEGSPAVNIQSIHRYQWLRVLYQGQGGGVGVTAGAAARAEETSRLNTLLHGGGQGASTGPLSDDQGAIDANSVVAFNAFGDKNDDAVAAICFAEAEKGLPRGQHRQSSASDRGVPFAGVWPQFSLLNHSCLPNAIHYTIGR